MIQFLKVRDVKSPVRDVNENAGIDIFIPEKSAFTEQELANMTIEDGQIMVLPGEGVIIPLGIKSKFDKDIALLAVNKSGIASKKHLIVGACLVDSSYQGELLLHLQNVGNREQKIAFGCKIIQFVPIKINTEVHTVTTDDSHFYEKETNRGNGGFGSTGI